jgi:hypothetical protein
MSTKFLTSVDLTNQQLLNLRLQQLAADPSSPQEGWAYWNTVSHTLRVYNGSAWISFSAGSGTVTSVTAGDGTITIAGTATDPTVKVAKALDHTWITDFDTQVRTSRLDQMAAPTAAVACGSQRFTSAADPTSAQDLATKNYVDLASQGFDFKASVRVVATTNATLASAYANGSVVDGITLATGNRILLAGQTTASENGIYTVAASGAPTRAADADASGEISPGAFIPVEAGTLGANSVYYCTATGATPWVPNSSTSTWSRFSSLTDLVAGNGLGKTGSTLNVIPGNGILADGTSTRADPAVVVRKFAATIGDGSTTAIAVTHSLGTKDITYSVRDATSDAMVQCDVVATSTTVATFTFAVAPTTNQYRVVVHA